LLTRKDGKAPLRIWALLGARAGDNDQVLALAQALELPFETKQLEYNSLRRLGPNLLGRSLASLTPASRSLITSEPPPDVTISVGHRSVPVVRALRARSHGRTRSIHIGFPRVSPGEFDLVIATPQYPNPDHPHLLRIPFALTTAATRERQQDPKLESLPSPHRLLIVGGPTSYWHLDREVVRRATATLVEETGRDGGSLMVTTGPRTPENVRTEIAGMVQGSGVPVTLGAPGTSPSYASMLAAADTVFVTADSVAMVSDAIWTGKPVAMLPLAPTIAGRMAGPLFDLARPGRPRYPRDLRHFWRGLSELGLSDVPSRPKVEPEETKRRIIDHVQAVIERL
jgi:mitochondrial fission protein ELM1